MRGISFGFATAAMLGCASVGCSGETSASDEHAATEDGPGCRHPDREDYDNSPNDDVEHALGLDPLSDADSEHHFEVAALTPHDIDWYVFALNDVSLLLTSMRTSAVRRARSQPSFTST
jgi:hypothetical protein